MQARRLPEILTILAGIAVAVIFLAAKPQAAHTSPTPTPLPATGAPSSLPSQNSQNASEQLLRAQLESARYYDQQMLSTIYWSLSGVFLLVILVGGINWISNYRLYEREKDALKQEMATAFRNEVEKLSQDLRQEFQSLAKEDETRISEIRQELAKESKSFDSRLDAVHKSAIESAKSTSEAVRKDLLKFRYHFLTFAAEYVEEKKRGYLTIQTWIDFFEVIVELNWGSHAEFAYKGISKGIAMGGTVSYSNYDKFVAALNRVQHFPKPPSDLLKSLENVRT